MVNRVDANDVNSVFDLNDPDLQGYYLEEEDTPGLTFFDASDQVNVATQSLVDENNQELTQVVYRRMSDTPRNPVTGEVIEDERVMDKKKAARRMANIRSLQGQLNALESQAVLSEEDKILVSNIRNRIAEESLQLSNFSSGATESA